MNSPYRDPDEPVLTEEPSPIHHAMDLVDRATTKFRELEDDDFQTEVWSAVRKLVVEIAARHASISNTPGAVMRCAAEIIDHLDHLEGAEFGSCQTPSEDE